MDKLLKPDYCFVRYDDIRDEETLIYKYEDFVLISRVWKLFFFVNVGGVWQF